MASEQLARLSRDEMCTYVAVTAGLHSEFNLCSYIEATLYAISTI